jgi:hypothetical protein
MAQVILDTLTTHLDAPDNFCIGGDLLEVISQHGYIDQVNSDIYISPTGSDSNAGTTPDNPLQTIDYAMKSIYADSLHQHTVYLAPGEYSPSLNQQIFPFAVHPFVSLTGAGAGLTVLNAEQDSGFFGLYRSKNSAISGLTLTNVGSNETNEMIFAGANSDVIFQDIAFENCHGTANVGLSISSTCNITVANCRFDSLLSYSGPCGVSILNSSVKISNTVFHNLKSLGESGFSTAIYSNESTVVADRIIVDDCCSSDFGVISYGNTYGDASNQLTLTNSLFVNNDCNIDMSSGGVVIASNPFAPSTITNCTFADNRGTTPNVLTVYGEANLRNNILWNPELDSELRIIPPAHDDVHCILNASYNDIRGGQDGIVYGGSGSAVNWGEGNIDADPLFLGGDPFSYQLSENSPCIDSGTPDTLGLGIPDHDLLNASRVWNGRIDMGCYEYGSTGSNDETVPPVQVSLDNYPNPIMIGTGATRSSNPHTFIEFTLPEPIRKKAEVSIYNIKGQRVKTLEVTTNIYELARKAGVDTRGKYSPNAYSAVWDCRDDRGHGVASGIYVYRLVVDGKPVAARKLMIVR